MPGRGPCLEPLPPPIGMRILDAAMVEVSAKGFAGARVSEIARRAGVNQQLISYCFGGKQGLYEQLGHRWKAHEAEAIPAGTPLGEMIKS